MYAYDIEFLYNSKADSCHSLTFSFIYSATKENTDWAFRNVQRIKYQNIYTECILGNK